MRDANGVPVVTSRAIGENTLLSGDDERAGHGLLADGALAEARDGLPN